MKPELKKNQNISLLIVDDNLLNRDLLSRRLSKEGYNIAEATGGREALELITKHKYDLILLDLMMPDISGYKVLSLIKSDSRSKLTPVIVVSAMDDIQIAVRCIEMGAEDYLTKPVNPVLLKTKVAACLEKKELLRREAKLRKQIQAQNEILEERVRSQVLEITESHLGTIFAMSKLAESRDPDTGEHLERMREYCRVLSRELKTHPGYKSTIDQSFIDNIYAASPLHDIGKVGIPDAVLLKKDKLSAFEWEIMKKHSKLSAETLRAVDRKNPGNTFIRTGIEIALYHHEKWNGKGYPAGLSGNEIPLSARILALVDVYDALTSKRCYKEAYSHEKSIKIIQDESGIHFDPSLVDAFININAEFINIRNTFRELQEQQLV